MDRHVVSWMYSLFDGVWNASFSELQGMKTRFSNSLNIQNQMMKIAKICDDSYEIEIPSHACLEIRPMLHMCLNRSPKSRPLPNEILSSFLFSENMSEKLKHIHSYMAEDEFKTLYSQVNKLIT